MTRSGFVVLMCGVVDYWLVFAGIWLRARDAIGDKLRA
jgi:hypothetical protein